MKAEKRREHPIVFKAVADPSPFMDAKFKRAVRYFCTAERAQKFGRIFLRLNPHGEVLVLTKKRRGA